MKFFLQVFLVFFSGVILALAIPNEILTFGSPILGMFSLVPFYIALANAKNFTRAMYLTMIQTLVVHVLSSFWLFFFKSAGLITLGSSAIGNSLLSSFFGALMFMPRSLENKGTKLAIAAGKETWRIPLRVIWFPVAYIIWEWVKSTGFLAYPWGTLSTTAFEWRHIMQIADITGTYGVTFLFAFFAAVVGEGILLFCSQLCRPANTDFSASSEFSASESISAGANHFAGGANSLAGNAVSSYKNVAAAWILIFAVSSVYGVWQCAKPRIPVKKLNAVMVQQNFDPWQAAIDTETILSSEKMSREQIDVFKQRDEKADLVVWSEGVLSMSFPDAERYYRSNPIDSPLIPFIEEMKTPFIIGGSYALDKKTSKYRNAAFIFDKNGKIRDYYGKLHLVPFAEVIPFVDMSEKFRKFIYKNFGFAGWTVGDSYVFFDIPANYAREKYIRSVNLSQSEWQQKNEEKEQPNVRVSTPICYDDAFPEVMRPLWWHGTELFMNMSDDSWSQKKSAEIQHAVVASYRAIECRTTLARSTNAGYSVIFDPCARILFEMPFFESTAAAVPIPVYERTCTVYMILGNWLPALCVFCAAIFSFIIIILKTKSRILTT